MGQVNEVLAENSVHNLEYNERGEWDRDDKQYYIDQIITNLKG
jgi:hypothetical protein